MHIFQPGIFHFLSFPWVEVWLVFVCTAAVCVLITPNNPSFIELAKQGLTTLKHLCSLGLLIAASL